MDDRDFDDFGCDGDIGGGFKWNSSTKPSPVKVKTSGDPSTGHHYAKFKVLVPTGMDANELADMISTKIGSSPAPFSPTNKPTEIPTPTKTIGMPSLVSKASSEDNSDHNVQVQAMSGHILSPKDGSSAGINYHTYPHTKKNGKQEVVTEKESYGDGPFKTLRYGVGTLLLNPHIESHHVSALDELMKKASDEKKL